MKKPIALMLLLGCVSAWAAPADDLDCIKCVGTPELAKNSVGTGKLKDGAVTVEKVAPELSNAIGTFCLEGQVVVGMDSSGNFVCESVTSDFNFVNSAYDGVSSATNGVCISAGPFATDSADLLISINGNTVGLQFDNFFGETLLLNGTIDDASGILTANGTFQTSDFKTGNWVLNYVENPTTTSLVIVIEFNQNGCISLYEFTGLEV